MGFFNKLGREIGRVFGIEPSRRGPDEAVSNALAAASAVHNAMMEHQAAISKQMVEHQALQSATLKRATDQGNQTQMRARRGRRGNVFGETIVGDNQFTPRLG